MSVGIMIENRGLENNLYEYMYNWTLALLAGHIKVSYSIQKRNNMKCCFENFQEYETQN